MLALLLRRDRPFLRRALRAVVGSARAARVGPVGDVHVPEPLPEAGPVPLDPDLPPALVTPRMLWARFGRDAIRRVARPA